MANTWNVPQLVLEAFYINHDTDRATVACRSLSVMPPEYFPQRTMSEGEPLSERVPKSLVATGVDVAALKAIDWKPTDISFTDSGTGEHKQFGVYSYTSEEPDKAKFLLSHEVKP